MESLTQQRLPSELRHALTPQPYPHLWGGAAVVGARKLAMKRITICKVLSMLDLRYNVVMTGIEELVCWRVAKSEELCNRCECLNLHFFHP